VHLDLNARGGGRLGALSAERAGASSVELKNV
jgi:hypothetical protein